MNLDKFRALRSGDRVKILSGEYKGQEAVLKAFPGDEMCYVEVPTKVIWVSLHGSQVELIPSPDNTENTHKP